MICNVLKVLALLALLCGCTAAHAACVPNNGYPWPHNGCVNSADLNSIFASILANGSGALISAPKPLGSGQDDRPAIQAFLNTNCSKGPILFFGAYSIGYPGLIPPRNCIYGGATTFEASSSGISGYPFPTMFTAIGSWSDNTHCIINQNHDGQWVHDLTLVGLNVISPQVCGIRALNSVQWTWFNVNTYQTYRGRELIGDSNQPCGDSECWTNVGQILFGSDGRNMAEGILMYNLLPGESSSTSFVSDIFINGIEEENNCNATSGTRTDLTFLPSHTCSGIGMYASIAGINLSGNGRSEDTFVDSAYGLIGFNVNGMTITGLAFDLNQEASIWLQNTDNINLSGIQSSRPNQKGDRCGNIRLTGDNFTLTIAGSNFDIQTTPIFASDNFTGFNSTLQNSNIQLPLNGQRVNTFNNSGSLYCVDTPFQTAQNLVSPFVTAPPNAVTVTPADPTGTTSGTGLMMGLGLVAAPNTSSITPAKTGNILVTISGNNANAASITAKYGTGTAPANAAAPTGTTLGKTALSAATGAFTITGLIPAAAVTYPVTPVWVDLDLAASTGTATVTNLAISLTEQ